MVRLNTKSSFIIDFVESSISDRGIQYCCPDYSQFAENKGFILSTTQQYDPYELRSNHEYQ